MVHMMVRGLEHDVMCHVMLWCQNIRDLTPLTHEVISRQATINIGLSFNRCFFCIFVISYTNPVTRFFANDVFISIDS